MRIAIIGLGGVGGYLCASLAKTSHEIVGFARGEHLQEIATNGLSIVEDEQTFTTMLHVSSLQEAQGYFDVVLFCVKSYDLVSSYQHIQNHIDKNTTLLSFSNGVSSGDVLRQLSNSYVLDGCIYILSHIEKAGVIRKKGKVFAAVFGGDDEKTKILESLFVEADLRVKTPSDIQNAIWKKYIFISAFASLTSFYNQSIGYVYQHHKQEAKELLQEIANVAKAKGIDLSSEIEKSLLTASKVPYDSSTSMHLDFQKSKKTELETLTYYIVKEGKKLSIATPLMQKIYNRLLAQS